MPNSAGCGRNGSSPPTCSQRAVPQLTALAMVMGGIFSGTVITEQVFTYPGMGSLLVRAVNGGDTHGGDAMCTFPSFLSRLRSSSSTCSTRCSTHASRPSSDVFRIQRSRSLQQGICPWAVPGALSVAFSCLSFFSPVDPTLQFVVPPTCTHRGSTGSAPTRCGQDLFWQATFAIRNTLAFGLSWPCCHGSSRSP